MSEWTHLACAECYARMEPGREPAQLKSEEVGLCCFCRSETPAVLFYRYSPAALTCDHSEGGYDHVPERDG